MSRKNKIGKDASVDSVAQFTAYLHRHHFTHLAGRHIFRGHARAEYELKPSIGSLGVSSKKFDSFESKLFKLFKRQAIGFLKVLPQDDYEWLAVAQHHGLPTRLLDWSANPLVALFFAVREHPSEDGHVYVLEARKNLPDDRNEFGSPFGLDKDYKYVPRTLVDRLTNQEALFTVHSEPQQCMEQTLREDWKLTRLVVKKEKKTELLYSLFRMGVQHARLFPDLDGLARHLKWQQMAVPVSQMITDIDHSN